MKGGLKHEITQQTQDVIKAERKMYLGSTFVWCFFFLQIKQYLVYF